MKTTYGAGLEVYAQPRSTLTQCLLCKYRQAQKRIRMHRCGMQMEQASQPCTQTPQTVTFCQVKNGHVQNARGLHVSNECHDLVPLSLLA